MGVFSKNQGGKRKLKRNNYSVSRRVHTTFNFGQLIPFSVREINPGESVKIKPSVGLRFMPTYFPVQNKMKAYINYFYVRSRNLYSQFKQFYEDNNPSLPMPYLGFPSSLKAQRSKMFSVGGLADHMGVAVTRHVQEGEVIFTPEVMTYYSYGFTAPFRYLNIGNSPFVPFGETPIPSPGNPSNYSFVLNRFSSNPPTNSVPSGRSILYFPFKSFTPSSSPYLGNNIKVQLSSLLSSQVISYLAETGLNCYLSYGYIGSTSQTLNFVTYTPVIYGKSLESEVSDGSEYLSISIPSKLPLSVKDLPATQPVPSASGHYNMSYTLCLAVHITSPKSTTDNYLDVPSSAQISSSVPHPLLYASSGATSVGSSLSTFNPFSEELNAESFVPLNSLPFRAYEQIYNAFYRDERNNPLMIDGKPVYDEFLTNTDGGVDNTDYQIRYRNWEQDCYTTALPSPQQGIAPLVGITSSGIATFQDLESGKNYTVQSEVADDGNTVIGAHYTSETIEAAENGVIPNSVNRALINYATSGISINDFRNVNALQRWKELNLRRGRKYKDLMEARFGVNISYAEMNMPEFIGGASFDVTPVQVNQTTNNGSDDPLGSYAGQLFASGGSRHAITKFCDEHGYIIGIISVVPTPVYETVTPKHFFKSQLLDFWQPEFNHIGLQPIPMKELDVFGQFSKSPDNMDEEFGYQRPWYDYISALDSVHGQFRTSLSSFVMYRSWSEPPTLSPDFLLVDSDSGIDDVFSVRTDSDGNSVDKILGQIYEDYTIKSPVSKYGIAKLE